ncbi:hypothetical protein Tco_0599807 [Tanacetum coccineum]
MRTPEGVHIISITTEVAPVIKENILNFEQPEQLGATDMSENDDKEASPILNAYLIGDKAEHIATASTYIDKVDGQESRPGCSSISRVSAMLAMVALLSL